MDPLRDFPGCNTAAYFAARGLDLSPEESRGLLSVLLRLADLDALSPRADARAAHEHPKGARRTCTHGTGDSGAIGGRRNRETGSAEGPTVYNMGPSVHGGAS